MAQTKPYAIQVSDADRERFDAIAEASDVSKSVIFSQLLDLYQEQHLAEQMPGREDDIKAFDASVDALKSLYRSALVLVDVEKENSKRAIVSATEVANNTIKKQNEELEKTQLVVADLLEQVEKLTKSNEALEKSLAEKESVIKALQKSIDENNKVQSMVAEMRELLTSAKKDVPVEAVKD